MRKMLVLGSDFFTLSVVKEAQNQGVYVIVTDLMENSPTKEAANEKWMVSTADIDELEQLCVKNTVSAIMFGASDFNVEKGRELCKRLNLPIYCDSELAWNASRNKSLFKKICKEVGAPVAKDYKLTDQLSEDELKDIEYPVVVKPVDKSGNRGVSFCSNRKELIEGYKYARSISDSEDIIVEQKLTGTEHHVCYAVGNGEVRLVSFAEANHDSKQASNIYSFERNTSRFLKQYIEEVNDYVIAAFKKLGCREGVVWVDTMRDENDGKFYVLEMGYRFAGAMASCPLYEKVSGFNAVKWMVESSLGVNHTEELMPKALNNAYKSTLGLAHMFTKKDGVISKIEGLDVIKKIPDVFVDMPKGVGDSVRGLATIALISIYGDSCEDLIDKLKKINNSFKVFDENNCNLLIYYTDYDNILKTYDEGNEDFYR
ncbi:MAG: ATP-grasp domain-containing protein [Wujia sp.]